MADALGINPSPTGAFPMPPTGAQSPAGAQPAAAQPTVQSGAQQMVTQRQGDRQQLAGVEHAIQPMPHPPTDAELTIHPKQATMFFPLLMALGALGGMNTRAPMTAAMNNMTAVMKGQMEGEQALTKQHEERLWRNFDAGMEAHKRSMEDYKVALDKYNSTGNSTDMRLYFLASGVSPKDVDSMLDPHSANRNYADQMKIAEAAQKNADEMQFKNKKLQSELDFKNKKLGTDTAEKEKNRGQKSADEYDREITSLTKDEHNTVNAAEKTAIEERIKELRRKRNAAQSGDAPAAPAGGAAPTQADKDYVKAHPETRAAYVSHFGVEP